MAPHHGISWNFDIWVISTSSLSFLYWNQHQNHPASFGELNSIILGAYSFFLPLKYMTIGSKSRVQRAEITEVHKEILALKLYSCLMVAEAFLIGIAPAHY